MLAANSLLAQEPYLIALNQTNGLPSNAVFNIYQDPKGFMWFATQEGITRYDGAAYKTYKCDAQVSTAGSCIKEDRLGRIWYENFDGRLYYVFQDSLYALAQKSVFNYAPFAITSRYLILVQYNGVDVYDLKSLQFLKKINFGTDFEFFESSIADGGDFYVFLGDILYHLNERLELNKTNFFVGKNEYVKQVYAGKGEVFVLSKANSKQCLHVFDRNLKTHRTLAIPGPKHIQAANFVDDKFWIHTPSGTFVYPLSQQINDSPKLYLTGKSVSGVIKDRQNNYWFSTTSSGAFLMPDLGHKFYPTKDFTPIKIVKTATHFLVCNKDASFLIFTPGKKIELPEPNHKINSELYYLYADSVTNDIIFSAKGMTVFPESNSAAAQEYDVALKEITRVDNQYYAFAANGYCALFKTPRFDNKLRSSWDSLFSRNPFQPNPSFADVISNIRGRSIAFDQTTQTIYCSGNRGLFAVSVHKVDTIKMNGAPFYASKIFPFAGQLFLLSTKGNLFRVDQGRKFSSLNSSLGIAKDDIKYARQFGNKLLLLSGRFIHCVDLNTMAKSIVAIDIAASAINDFYLEGNTIILLTNDGIITSELSFGARQKEQCQFRINSFSVNELPQRNFQGTVFSHKQNDISIHFSLLDFGNVNLQPLFYSINKEGWKLLPSESRSLLFKSLSPGTYTIAFKLGDKVLPDIVNFTIDQPFWMKWWFLLLCIAAFSFIIFSYYKWKVSLLSKQIQLLNDKVALEQSLGKSILTSIKSQMNPHFFYNALNTIQAYIFTNDKRNASVYLGKFSKLTRMILEMSEKELIPLQEEIQALTLYLELEKMRFDDDLFFEIRIDPSVDVDMVKIPSMLIQPYAENAIKHGLMHRKGQKHLLLEMTMEGKYLKVVIDDNGIGRAKSEIMKVHKGEKHTSFSTRANEQRLEILNRNRSQKVVIEIEDKVNETNNALGTQVRLLIPLEL